MQGVVRKGKGKGGGWIEGWLGGWVGLRGEEKEEEEEESSRCGAGEDKEKEKEEEKRIGGKVKERMGGKGMKGGLRRVGEISREGKEREPRLEVAIYESTQPFARAFKKKGGRFRGEELISMVDDGAILCSSLER